MVRGGERLPRERSRLNARYSTGLVEPTFSVGTSVAIAPAASCVSGGAFDLAGTGARRVALDRVAFFLDRIGQRRSAAVLAHVEDHVRAVLRIGEGRRSSS